MEHLCTYSDIDILGTAIEQVNKEGRCVNKRSLPSDHDDIAARVFKKPLVYHPTIFIRKSVFEEYGYYDEKIRWGEDADLWYRLIDDVTFANLDVVLLRYTVKDRLKLHQALSNFRIKLKHLKSKKIIFKFIPQLGKDALILSLNVIKHSY